MLSPHDAQVVEREPHVPGVRLLFDGDAFLAALQSHCPELGATRAKPWYARYKPATSCLVAFQVDTARGPLELYAKAYRKDDRPKLEKAARGTNDRHPSLRSPVVFEEAATLVRLFPDDGEIPALPYLADPARLSELLGKVLPDGIDCSACTTRRLAYKPERRFVAQIFDGGGIPRAVLKLHSQAGFERMSRNAKVIQSGRVLRVAQRLGRSERYSALALEWMDGELLVDRLAAGDLDPARIALVGQALAELHAHPTKKLAKADTRRKEADSLLQIADAIAHAHPPAAPRVRSLAGRLADWLLKRPVGDETIHGDFYAKQVLLQDGGTVAYLDLDEVRRGDPSIDLGNFAAHLERHALAGRLDLRRVDPIMSALRQGYADAGGVGGDEAVRMYTAVCLLRLTPQPFRDRQLGWPKHIDRLVERTEELCDGRAPGASSDSGRREWRNCDVAPADGGNAALDPAIPFLRRALDPAEIQHELDRGFVRADESTGPLLLRAVRMIRHKPGRRCIVEYDVETAGQPDAMTLVGKIRSKGLDVATYSLNLGLRQLGFDENAPDGIAVPRPVGTIPSLRMWLQRKIGGEISTDLLAGEQGVAICRRLGEVAAKLHRARLPGRRRHTIEDELRILKERLATVSHARPEWEPRLHRLFAACEQLAATLPAPLECGIHRDYYPGQLIIDGPRAYLLDLDLYCQGDPALDVGNCAAHIIESALRTAGSPTGANREAALIDRYLELTGPDLQPSIDAYATLTLARHVYISTQFPDRAPFTEAILSLCEDRLGIAQNDAVVASGRGWASASARRSGAGGGD